LEVVLESNFIAAIFFQSPLQDLIID